MYEHVLLKARWDMLSEKRDWNSWQYGDHWVCVAVCFWSNCHFSGGVVSGIAIRNCYPSRVACFMPCAICDFVSMEILSQEAIFDRILLYQAGLCRDFIAQKKREQMKD